MKRKKKKNPSGADVVGALVGFVVPIGASMLVGGFPIIAAGTTAVAGTAAAIAGAEKPGFFRGAAVGSAASMVVAVGLSIWAAHEVAAALKAAQAQPPLQQPQATV